MSALDPAGRIDSAGGTDESRWDRWPASQDWPALDLGGLRSRPLVVLAAHPDDEVLGVGGLLALLATAGASVAQVWATDGEASHPGSTAAVVARLGEIRREESVVAARALGLEPTRRTFLGLPDGALAAHADVLTQRLRALVPEGAVLLAPWSRDAHPDHEACGRAAAVVAGAAPGVGLLEYPVWMWHWAQPDDPRVPWRRARRVDLDDTARRRKADAVACFRSQIAPVGPEPADGPVLPGRVLAHFGRAHEVVFGADTP